MNGPRCRPAIRRAVAAGAMEMWAIETGVQLCFIRPGRPVENGFIVTRVECLKRRVVHDAGRGASQTL